MSAQVAYECGFLDATRHLRAGTYISPYLCLEHTTFHIPDAEIAFYYQGCIDAVIEHFK
jgi:hypothetical protein